jgi:LytS/YehU family sensor histidine kinase
MIVFFYVNLYVLIPKFYFKRKYIHFYVIVFVCFLSVTLIPYLLIQVHPNPPGALGPPPPPEGKSIIFEFGHNFFSFFVIIFVSLTVKISDRWMQSERERLNAELSYLKAQINPHFLFNTLNSIYSLAIEKSDATATAVVKLSGMMRYVVSEAHHDLVPLEKEISYIQNYIALQRIRFGDAIRLSFTVAGDTHGRKIAPLILIPFVENAFKHGVNAEENSEIKIMIDIKGTILYLEVHNNKVSVVKTEDMQSGVGIENTRNRLKLSYPDNHVLSIHENENDFVVSLMLNLK